MDKTVCETRPLVLFLALGKCTHILKKGDAELCKDSMCSENEPTGNLLNWKKTPGNYLTSWFTPAFSIVYVGM